MKILYSKKDMHRRSMKQQLKGILLLGPLFLFFLSNLTAQTVFMEDFGQSTTRLESPYMPLGSFIYGDPYGDTSQKAIENNYYAVIDPIHIADDYAVPYYWFWTGPEPVGNTFGGRGNPPTEDHTPGDTNGAVMVVNAGSTLDYFYVRPVSLEAGSCYRISFWTYLVNADSQVSIDVRDVATQTVLDFHATTYLNTEDVWTQISLDFKMPNGCTSSDIEIALRNEISLFTGNDYYIDDIVLEKLVTCTATDIANCPTGTLATIKAVEDNLTDPAINGVTGGTTATVLSNDVLNGTTTTTATVNVSSVTVPLGFTLNLDGTITVAPGTATGIYNVEYRICEIADPTNCDTATAVVLVDFDTDGDGVLDSADLDDDNDGILDDMECPPSTTIFADLQPLSPAVIPPTGLVAGDRIIKTGALVYPTETYDAIIDILEVNVGSGYFHLSGGGMQIENPIPAENPYVMIRLSFVPTGTVTDGSPFTPSTISKFTLYTGDVDGNWIPGFGDVIGSLASYIPGHLVSSSVGSNVVNQGFTMGNSGIGGPGPGFIYHRPAILDGTSIVPNVTSSDKSYGVEGTFVDYTTDDFVFGVTGDQTTPINGGRAVYAEMKAPLICDADGDGIPNTLDTDSDNDGCPDAVEYYGLTNAVGTDGNDYYGNGNPPMVNADGTVIAAPYVGDYTNVANLGTLSTIDVQPVDQLVNNGANASFTIVTSDGSGTTSYQWQESTDGGTTWIDITDGGIYSGATTSTVTLTAVTTSMDGYNYRVTITQSDFICGSQTSTTALLDIQPVATDDTSNYDGTVTTVDILANDTTSDIVVATTVSFVGGTDTDANGTLDTLVVPGEGTWMVNPVTGAVTFTPEAGFTGTPTPVQYNVEDAEGNTSNNASISLASIQLEKDGTYVDTNGDGMVNAGDEIHYVFTVLNTGNVTLTNITISDANAIVTGGSIASLAVGTTDNITFTAAHVLTQSDVDTGYIENSAVATGDSPSGTDDVTDTSDAGDETVETPNGDGSTDGDPTNDPTVTTLAASPELTVTKTVATPGTAVGDVIVYNIEVENTGNVTLANIEVTDANADGGSIVGSPIATLAPGGTATVTAEQTIAQSDVDAGYIENSAVATGDSPSGTDDVTDTSDAGDDTVETPNGDGSTDGDPTNDPTVTTLAASPELMVTKDGSLDMGTDGVATVGDEIHYVFTIENTGNVTLTNITITDANATVTGGSIANLAVGATDSVTFTATHVLTQSDINAGYVYNLATLTGTDPDGNPVSDNSTDPTPCATCPVEPSCVDCTITDLAQSPSLQLEKDGTYVDTNGDGTVNVGDEIAYTFTVTNTGNVTLTNVVVNDYWFDPAMVIAPLSSTVLAPGEIATTTATHILTSTEVDNVAVYNIADVTSDGPDGTPVTVQSVDPTPLDANNPYYDPTCSSCTVVVLESNPGIAVVKTAAFNDENGDDKAQVGETITYRFAITNIGDVTLNNIIVDDALPNLILTGRPITLLPGEVNEDEFVGSYTITLDDIIKGYVENQATVTGITTVNAVATVTDTSDDDSIAEDEPTVTLLEGCSIRVYNSVSPNGDGRNDELYIEGIECFSNNSLEIYNRWGVKVFGMESYDNGTRAFKGYSNGRLTLQDSNKLPTGTYWYVLRYIDLDGNTRDKVGYIYINY